MAFCRSSFLSWIGIIKRWAKIKPTTEPLEMEILKEGLDVDSFFDNLRGAPSRALLLDYDGTLAPFRIKREEALPYPGVRELLDDIIGGGHTRVVIITGRAIDSLLPLLGLRHSPEIWGVHGRERMMPDRTYRMSPLSEAAERGLSEAQSWIRAEGLQDWIEEKPGCLALHIRGKDPGESATVLEKVSSKWSAIAKNSRLLVEKFDGGLELREKGEDKGQAVRTILSEMDRSSVTAYLGDDVADEDAFKALPGRNLKVLVRTELRSTAADVWLKPPEELLSFFDRWKTVLEVGVDSRKQSR